ncbi:Restriction endonuclease type IV Mrr domain-containing protein [Vibrio crassostreae]|nr:Restriction endonuclease type IV Mrr domain-containing protein [Vibrio crassostreae]CAK2888063.1 Restriction endonuclease type IV Mrr domain-containing protein [Vibrio crassostreae]CAK2890195.1 Restriction endonuclease type IV Mrr domain-containing protein [Vibrio crassostreae]CAK2892109.1 Restriction endonuclease type IV Mrr domain-containing protein [Vibrio crassostreae]CAK2895681.1 Restriction endonuclease type IV Mrr domain-containing protein [Vibrio crassostreae]
MRTSNIFGEKELSRFLDAVKQNTLSSIESEKDDYILNVSETDYIAHKLSEAIIEPLEIHEDQIYASSSERMIPAELFPNAFHVRSGNSYKKDVIKFHVPISGNIQLLHCVPSTRLMWSMSIEVNRNEFCFEIINFSNDPDAIVRDKDSNLRNIMQQQGNVRKDVDRFNSSLEAQIKSAFESKKQRVKQKSGLLASLGVPIKKSSAPSATFSVRAPQKRKKITVNKPQVREVGYTPEPTLDESVYNDILQLIHDVGKEFERLPSLYAGKEEEHLRDHFLMMLEPNFNGSATGETFNKTGKTDILLRYENTNVFIGECKFWKGKKNFLGTISQLLGYLTWRDSKAAVIMFVPNKDFTNAIDVAKSSVNEHPNFIKFVNEKDETWYNYEFHLNGDRNRAVKIAVMLYHTPR